MILHVLKRPDESTLARCREVPSGTPAPDGWEAMTVHEFQAWEAAQNWTPPAPVAPTYPREDYKQALDAMLQAQCQSYEFDGLQTLTLYLWGEPSKFQLRAQWLARLNIFTWETSDDMAAQPPAGDPPPPDQFAGYILALFEQSNPRP